MDEIGDLEILRRRRKEEQRRRREEERHKRSLELRNQRQGQNGSNNDEELSGLAPTQRKLEVEENVWDDEEGRWIKRRRKNRRPPPSSPGNRDTIHQQQHSMGPRIQESPGTFKPPRAGVSMKPSPAASSVSSVSLSMSPRKPHAQACANNDDDDDFVAIAMRLEQKRQKKAALETSMMDNLQEDGVEHELPPLTRSFGVAKKEIHQLDADEHDDDDDDFVKCTRRLVRKKEKHRRVNETLQRALEDSPTSATGENDGHGSDGMRSATSQKRQEHYVSRSPPALHLGRIEHVARIPRQDEDGDDDSLFDTDEEELNLRKRALPSSKRRKRTPRLSPDKTKTARNDNSIKPRHRKNKQKSSFGDVAEVESSDDDRDGGNDPEYGLKPQRGGDSLEELRPLEPLVLEYGEDEEDLRTNEVPAPMNRFLKDYQQDGIRFLHKCITEHRGAILGDDMGLGKTIQVLGLLSALLKKTGTREDEKELKRRSRLIVQRKKEVDRVNSEALLEGRPIVPMSRAATDGLKLTVWAPLLIITPASVLPTWQSQFERWGYFAVSAYQSHGRSLALESVRSGSSEILLCGNPLFCQEEGFQEISSVPWKLIVVDEYHQCKNEKSIFYKNLKHIKSQSGCPMLGLTGTLMQNNHQELWNLVDLVEPDLLGPWSVFNNEVAAPIKYGRTKTAGDEVIEKSNIVAHILDHRMGTMYLARQKKDVLSDELPLKEQRVVFCPLEPIQKRLYQHIINLPEYALLRFMYAPCDCGVNRAIFAAYKKLRNNRERIEFLHRHEDEIVKRKQCCYQTPINDDGQGIDSRAVIWRAQHEGDEACSKCPDCLLFPSLSKLWKVCSHAALIQAHAEPTSCEEGSTDWKNAAKEFDFARVAIPDDILPRLPGGSYVREDSIMNDHSSLSGKMRVLEKLLRRFDAAGDRALVFSTSTATLTLIENFIRSRGYTYLRLDGKVPTKDRQALINRFQGDDGIFLFLISTKAGGLGLNLTAANVVIVFDTSYNPSNDEQAEDRAFRIGQKKDVRVYRLVSQGTIEELTYIRQIYKVQLKQETLKATEGGQSARIFNGVAGDPKRRGELFGTVNLLKYKDGSFMDDMWKAADDGVAKKGQGGVNEQHAVDMQGVLAQMSNSLANLEDQVHQADFDKAVSIAQENDEEAKEEDEFGNGNVLDHQAFFNVDRGDAALKPGDDGFEEEMGGESQIAHQVLKEASIDEEGNAKPAFVDDSAADSGGGLNNARATGKEVPVDEPVILVASAPAFANRDRVKPAPYEGVRYKSHTSDFPKETTNRPAADASASRSSCDKSNGGSANVDGRDAACTPFTDPNADSSAEPLSLKPTARREPKARRRRKPPSPPKDLDVAMLFDLPSYDSEDANEG